MEDKEILIGKYKVKVIRSACISASACVAVSPNVFQLDNQGIAVVQENGKDADENVLLAAQSCPVKAIVITDAQTGEQIWPQ